MRAGFKHYEVLLEDGKENQQTMQQKLRMPVLVLSGERGIPHQQTLDSVLQVSDSIESDIVPKAGHLFAYDNPVWTANRLRSFIGKA